MKDTREVLPPGTRKWDLPCRTMKAPVSQCPRWAGACDAAGSAASGAGRYLFPPGRLAARTHPARRSPVSAARGSPSALRPPPAGRRPAWPGPAERSPRTPGREAQAAAGEGRPGPAAHRRVNGGRDTTQAATERSDSGSSRLLGAAQPQTPSPTPPPWALWSKLRPCSHFRHRRRPERKCLSRDARRQG